MKVTLEDSTTVEWTGGLATLRDKPMTHVTITTPNGRRHKTAWASYVAMTNGAAAEAVALASKET